MLDSIEELLSHYSEDVQALSLLLRKKAQQIMPEAREFVYHAAINYALSD
jgi:hypothetical protein